VRGSNITPDRDIGIGAWSEDDIKRLLTQGVRPSGVRVAPQMPYAFYKILAPSDLDAIAIYLKIITPVSNEVPPPVYKAAAYPEPLPGVETSIGDMIPADPVKRGFYLATLAHCMECHSRRPDGVQDYTNWWGKGGHEMKGPFGSVIVSNISSHKDEGRRRVHGCRAQARAYRRYRPRRTRAQAADGKATLFQHDDGAGHQRHHCLGAHHSADRMKSCSFVRVPRMSQRGHSRRFDRAPATSGLPPLSRHP
jgi:hypothetical protein